MSKYKYDWNEEKYNKRVKEGRGKGTGNSYKPWITVHDFPSNGFISRAPGWKSNRVYHFMSTNELRYFYILEWSKVITDIREQFPLELDETMKIADELGIKHPCDNKSDFPIVLTTDFFITAIIAGKEVYFARTIKPEEYLENKRTIEKYQIEWKYWKIRGVSWKVVTDKDISKIFAENVEWIHTEYRLEPTIELSISEQRDICDILKKRLAIADGQINKVTMNIDAELNLESGTSLGLFKYLLANKEIIMDMNEKITGGTSIKDIISISNKDKKVKSS